MIIPAQKIIFIGLAAFLLACIIRNVFLKRKHSNAVHYNKITVTGNACNISGQAAIVGDSADTYFVEGMEKWEDAWLNHTVKIIGDLAGSKKTIKAAVVMLLDSVPQ